MSMPVWKSRPKPNGERRQPNSDVIWPLVGTIDGVTIHGDRLAVIGSPMGDHPLIGQSDPLDNASQNPVAYGSLDADL